MGTEIVFALIYPIAILSLAVAARSWRAVADRGNPGLPRRIVNFSPVIGGLLVSLIGLLIIEYFDTAADLSSLIQQGYYTEAEGVLYFSRRYEGNVYAGLFFVLPFVCCLVVPICAKLVLAQRLSWQIVLIYSVVGWFVLSLLGWLLNLASFTPPISLWNVLGSVGRSMIVYGSPVPVAALLAFGQQVKSKP